MDEFMVPPPPKEEVIDPDQVGLFDCDRTQEGRPPSSILTEGEYLMPEDKEFPRGLFVSAPRSSAPDFVKGRISIRIPEFLAYLGEKDGEWLRIDIKEGFREDDQGNKKWYSQVDTWVKPSARTEEEGDALPF
jgi:hypothetical protein